MMPMVARRNVDGSGTAAGPLDSGCTDEPDRAHHVSDEPTERPFAKDADGREAQSPDWRPDP